MNPPRESPNSNNPRIMMKALAACRRGQSNRHGNTSDSPHVEERADRLLRSRGPSRVLQEFPTSPQTQPLIDRVAGGDLDAIDLLFAELYSEIYKRAERVAVNGKQVTLRPTALVNEAYLRIVRAGGPWRDRSHFLHSAARAMRSVLVDDFRRKGAQKRDGRRVDLDVVDLAGVFDERAVDLEALDRALDQLQERDKVMAKAVELRFFGGLAMTEVAREVGLPLRTLERNWQTVRAWLYSKLS